jgi:uncharacterized protein (TIGR03083 family)
MESLDYVAILRERSRALLEVAQANLDAVVPSCPGWTNADLAAHMGGVWGWTSAVVRTGARSDLPAAPTDAGGPTVIAWAEEQLHNVLSTLEKADPSADCWTFGLPRTAMFWFRRQALETAVHTWDCQGSIGDPEPLDGELASDGIEEFLVSMLPRQIKREPNGWTGQSLHFQRSEGEGEWTVQLGPDGQVTTNHDEDKGDVALQGPASLLYLWCLNRVPTDALELFGDPLVAAQWKSEIAF